MSFKYTTVSKLVDKFHLKVFQSSPESLKRRISVTGFEFGNLELTGFFDKKHPCERVLIWGNKELEYILQLPVAIQQERLKKLMKSKIPCIILNKDFSHESKKSAHVVAMIIKVAKKLDFPILGTSTTMKSIIDSVGNYISQKLLDFDTLHGSLINVYGEGVLLIGASGIGKSEVILELLKKSHTFVGDDAIDYAQNGRYVTAQANDRVRNFLEVRGIGILNVREMFGIQAVQKRINITIVIEIVPFHKDVEFTRLDTVSQTYTLAGIKLPYYKIPLIPGRKMSDIVETAVIDMKLKHLGFDGNKEFIAMNEKINVEETAAEKTSGKN